MDYRFMSRRLKSMSMVFCASQARYNYGHHVHMHLIEIPTTSYVNATLKEKGHDFPKDNRGDV